MDLALRPRSATEIVDATFRLYRAHAAPFLTLSAVAEVPRLALGVAQVAVLGGTLAAAQAGAMPRMFSGAYLGLLLAGLLLYAFFEGAFLTMADDALRAGEPAVGSAFARGSARAPAVIAAFVLVALVVGVGFLLLVVPGIYLGLRLFPTLAAVAIEGLGPVEAIGHTWRRTRGAVGRAFVVLLLVFLMFVVGGVAGAMVGGVFGGLAGAFGSGGTLGGVMIATLLAQGLVTVLLYPLLSISTALFYYDTRVRSEGLDVEAMVDALGPAGVPGAAPAR